MQRNITVQTGINLNLFLTLRHFLLNYVFKKSCRMCCCRPVGASPYANALVAASDVLNYYSINS